MRALGFSAIALAIAMPLLPCEAYAQADEPRQPGHYALWASAEIRACQRMQVIVNRMPNQDVIAASRSKGPGFRRWTPGPELFRQVNPGGTLDLHPISHILTRLDATDQLSYVVKWTWLHRGVVNDEWLYILPRLPRDGAEMTEILRSRRPDYKSDSDADSHARLQKIHGDNWEDWHIGGAVEILAIPPGTMGPGAHFLAVDSLQRSSASTNLLVFAIDHSGVRKDICMLRRICDCTATCAKPLTTAREKSELIPSSKYCNKAPVSK